MHGSRLYRRTSTGFVICQGHSGESINSSAVVARVVYNSITDHGGIADDYWTETCFPVNIPLNTMSCRMLAYLDMERLRARRSLSTSPRPETRCHDGCV